MPTSHLPRCLGALLVVLTITGCSMLLPNQGLEPGWRRFIIAVDNKSPRPAILLVAEGTPPTGRVVGRATPSTVPPLSAMDVAFDVPPGQSWTIFVNPGPNNGGLIGGRDVPAGAAGKLPIKIDIETGPGTEGGSVAVPNLPGYFGN